MIKTEDLWLSVEEICRHLGISKDFEEYIDQLTKG